MRPRRPLTGPRPPLIALAALAGALVLALLLAPGASAGLITPRNPVSPNAASTDSLYKITLYIAAVIFVGVEGALVYALVRFRARRGAVAAQIRGNTTLEVGWTVGAAVILMALAILTFAKLSDIQNPRNTDANGDQLAGQSGTLYATTDRKLPPNGRSLNIQVIGRQFIWQYVYPGADLADGLGAPYSYEEMVVPTGTTVTLDITSLDVVHSWWIPQLGGKFQAVPGLHNYSWFKIEKPGTYRGQCAAICGRLHARMIAQVTAVPPAQFEAWLARKKSELSQADAQAAASRARLATQVGAGQVQNP